jgi:hypothetical protein
MVVGMPTRSCGGCGCGRVIGAGRVGGVLREGGGWLRVGSGSGGSVSDVGSDGMCVDVGEGLRCGTVTVSAGCCAC